MQVAWLLNTVVAQAQKFGDDNRMASSVVKEKTPPVPKTAANGASLVLRLGPGLITGAADDDPSGIATYSQVGAQFGTAMLWTTLFSFPLVAAYAGNLRAPGKDHWGRRFGKSPEALSET